MRYVAGRLKQFHQAWRRLSLDPFVLDAIKGYRIPFTSLPTQLKIPKASSLNSNDEPFMAETINNLIALGAIRPCPDCANQFLSSYFLVKKPNGKYRFVLNLKELNKFIIADHFKLEDIRTATKIVSEGWFMASLDLQDAFFFYSYSQK